MNYARLFYGDGASRSGNVRDPVSVPGNPAQQMWFRGAPSFDSALDLLLSLGMSEADLIIFTGGSAGGLTVFLHLDHVAERMKTEAPKARVVGEPVCGFFLDSGNDGYAPDNVTYTLELKYVYNMQKAGGSLSRRTASTRGSASWPLTLLRTFLRPGSRSSRVLITGSFPRSSSCRACNLSRTRRPTSRARAPRRTWQISRITARASCRSSGRSSTRPARRTALSSTRASFTARRQAQSRT